MPGQPGGMAFVYTLATERYRAYVDALGRRRFFIDCRLYRLSGEIPVRDLERFKEIISMSFPPSMLICQV